jgi:hypothetical protein
MQGFVFTFRRAIERPLVAFINTSKVDPPYAHLSLELEENRPVIGRAVVPDSDEFLPWAGVLPPN